MSGPSSWRGGLPRTTVLAVVGDEPTRLILSRVVLADRLFITPDMAEGLALAEQQIPDVAFVEISIGGGAGLAMVHHLKAVTPNVTIFALAARGDLDAAANAVALGGAGLLILPIGGDEVLSAISGVKVRAVERSIRAELERAASMYARGTGWMARVAELSDCGSRAEAAQALLDVLLEATSALGGAVYLSVGERPAELARSAVSSTLDLAPRFGMEPDILEFARRESLLAVPLATRTLKLGHVLLAEPREAARAADLPPMSARSAVQRIDGMVKLLATQATTAFALLAERDRAGGALLKDPGSSAYSFAYYVDIAGREIDKARRYDRRFAIATIVLEPPEGHAAKVRPMEVAELLLHAARDTDILARIDDNEFHLLMPETDGLGAHALRRRVLARLSERRADKASPAIPRGLLVGVATFPHDGKDLSQLLRLARRRADATKASIVHDLPGDQPHLADLLATLDQQGGDPPATELCAPRRIELPLADAAALAATVVADAMRGGAALFTVAHHANLTLGAAVRAAIGPPREQVTVHALDVRATHGDDIEALSVIAEHGAYALIARNQGGVVRGLHAADPLLADLLADRLGRAAGLRIFT